MAWKKITRTFDGTVTVEDVAGPPDPWPPAVDPDVPASMQTGRSRSSSRPMAAADAILYDVDGVATGYTENAAIIAYYEARAG